MGACEEVAACLGIDAESVFWFDRGARRPVIAVWIGQWTDADRARSVKLKAKVKAIAERHGAKVYLTEVHPLERERRETASRKNCKNRYVDRHGKKFKKQGPLWRREAWEHQKGRCMWCNQPVPKENATLEHIVPLSDGGSHEPPNLGMACGPCNSNRYKMSRIVTLWKLFKFGLRLKFRYSAPIRNGGRARQWN